MDAVDPFKKSAEYEVTSLNNSKLVWGQLNEFESIWGNITNKRNLVHFLLKYRYVANWDREVRENYLGYSADRIISNVDSKYQLIFKDVYTLPFLKEQVFKDFGIVLNERTHIKLIFKLKED